MDCPQVFAPGVDPRSGSTAQCILIPAIQPVVWKPSYCALICTPGAMPGDLGVCPFGGSCNLNYNTNGMGICSFDSW